MLAAGLSSPLLAWWLCLRLPWCCAQGELFIRRAAKARRSVLTVRTYVEFASTEFPAYEGEDEEINPGRFGKRLAEWRATTLPAHGLKVTGIGPEDWGWRVDLEIESQDRVPPHQSRHTFRGCRL